MENITPGTGGQTGPVGGQAVDAAPMKAPEVKIPSAFQIVVKGKDGQERVVKEGRFSMSRTK
jgi:hypothetical protein